MTPPLRALIVGDPTAPEMQVLPDALDELLPPYAERRAAADLTSALALPERDGWFPDLSLVCQLYPDQFPARDVMEALCAFPLTRWVICLGPWCESALRTGIAWPQSVCVPARACCERIAAELAVLSGDRGPLPLTAARDEVFAFDMEAALTSHPIRATVVVQSPDRPLAECLADICRRCGCRTTLLLRDTEPPPDVLLWDVDPWRDDAPARLGNYAATNPQTTVVALMGLAHAQDAAALNAAGVRHVVHKLGAASMLPRVVGTGELRPNQTSTDR